MASVEEKQPADVVAACATDADADMQSTAEAATTSVESQPAGQPQVADAQPRETSASAEATEDASSEEKQSTKIVVDGEESVEAQDAATPEKPQAQSKRQPWRSVKRNRELDVLTRKAEKLEREAGQADEVTNTLVADREKLVVQLRQLEQAVHAQDERISKQKEAAMAVRKAANKARQEEALHNVPEGRGKPVKPFNAFVRDTRPTLVVEDGNILGTIKKMAQMWADISEEQKQKYSDAYAAEKKEYAAWQCSEEGRAILIQRREALETPTKRVAPSPQVATPNKRVAPSSQVATPHKRVAPSAQVAMAAPGLDEALLAEADKLAMRAQLLNLANRPEIQALKKTPQELLEALRESSGMVNAAKRHLLG